MITIKFNLFVKITLILALIILSLSGCNDFLEEYPKNAVSEGTFWNNEKDAHQALMGCYNRLIRAPGAGYTGERFRDYGATMVWLSSWAGYSAWRDLNYARPLEITPDHATIAEIWKFSYVLISRTNYFLDNIEKVDMDEGKKRMMIGEARFLRSYGYFWLSQLYGNVPLIKTTLTFDEANNISQASEEEVENFIVNELTEIAPDLPLEHAPSDKGRIEKGAALALKGRVLMAQKRWSEAADTYKQIMNLNRYKIDPRFKELFEDEGENSEEIIFANKFMDGEEYSEAVTQHHIVGSWWGGWSSCNVFQNLVDEFPMMDGKTIEESDLYDPKNPFENRDPRLYATILLSGYSEVDGEIFNGRPDEVPITGPALSGYLPNKFWDRGFEGKIRNYGGDYKQMRYAEVLLSRLESELEAGNAIDQNLLDNTINKVRQREAVNMPRVTETNPDKLREIVRRERLIELVFEGGIEYFDSRRWETLENVFNRDIVGMQVTDNPEAYSGKFNINDKGHIIIWHPRFLEYNYLWPIPLDELDINKNLNQNAGYN